jgi:putative transcriptional regulator
MHAGLFIQSTSQLDNDFFEKAVVFITGYNDSGATGFVINRPFGKNLDDLEEFKHSVAFPLNDGGPVDREHLYFIHRRPDLVTGGTFVKGNLYMGGDFAAAVKCLNNKTLTAQDIKLFIGYCGWDKGELEAEIEEGSWVVTGDTGLF